MNESLQFSNNPANKTNSSAITKCLRFNFENTIDRIDNHLHFKGRRLLSPTSLLSFITQHKLANIPPAILERRRLIGISLMKNLEDWFINLRDAMSMILDPLEKTMLFGVLSWLVTNELKVMSVEKFIHNGVYCGYIDCIVKNKNGIRFIVEIKCRNTQELYITDRMQTFIYSQMIGGGKRVVLLVNDKGVCTHYVLNGMEDRSIWIKTTKLYKEYGVDLAKISKIALI